MVKISKIIFKTNCDAVVRLIYEKLTGVVSDPQRHNILKFKQNRPAGSETAKVRNLTQPCHLGSRSLTKSQIREMLPIGTHIVS